MKALRRSIKGEKNEPKMPLIPQKSAIAIVPPKKVIRALYDYEARSQQELSFTKGDFFHVIGRENDTEWYEACNPALPDARGLVPVTFFQSIGKTERNSGQSNNSAAAKAPDHDSGYSEASSTTVDQSRMSNMSKGLAPAAAKSTGTGAMVYGIVMYDFAAERPDELDAKQGEAIIVIAQSNPEWFVAKPIGRLGGPGLIPVSFIEIRDMTTGKAVPDAQEAVQRAGVPKVEEWKKMAAEYKNSSISLGKFENNQPQSLEQGMDRMSLQQGQRASQQPQSNYARQSQQARGMQNQQYPQQQIPNLAPTPMSQLATPVSAHIPRYCFAEEKYWFVVEAALEDGRYWELSRYYEDFYDFQIALLMAFPAEAGNTEGQKRTLPYMPGPVSYVTDAITEGRRNNLDSYVKSLLDQPPYISKCNLVKQFFTPREGDFEIDPSAQPDVGQNGGISPTSSIGTPDEASRQSSRQNLNSNNGGYGGLSAGTGRQNSGGNNPYGQNRQDSSLSQPSVSSLQNGNQQSQAMKVKIYFGDDLFAIRVPTDIQYQQLHEKIRERLKIPKGQEIAMYYRDESSGEKPGLVSNNDLDIALQRNDKLIITVEYN